MIVYFEIKKDSNSELKNKEINLEQEQILQLIQIKDLHSYDTTAQTTVYYHIRNFHQILCDPNNHMIQLHCYRKETEP